jgi:hypothetical protein
MLVAVQPVGMAAVPLKVTVLLPCVLPKYVPAMVTALPSDPEVGVRLEILAEVTVKGIPSLAAPLMVTTTFPVVAPVGTGTVMLVSLQLVGVAVVPLNVTVLVARVAPKIVPLIVTEVPTAPVGGERTVIEGDDCAKTHLADRATNRIKASLCRRGRIVVDSMLMTVTNAVLMCT